MSGDWSRPNWLARWGWIFLVAQLALVLPNVYLIVWVDGGWWNVGAALFCAANAVVCFQVWRRNVREDADHRAWMAAHDADLRAWMAAHDQRWLS